MQKQLQDVQSELTGLVRQWRNVSGRLQDLQGKAAELERRLGSVDGALDEFATGEQLRALRHDLSSAAARADSSAQVVVLRTRSSERTDFEILQKEGGEVQYVLRRYSIEFSTDGIDRPLSLKVRILNNGKGRSLEPQTLRELEDGQVHRFASIPFKLRVLYIKDSFVHRDLIFLSVVPDSRSDSF